MNIRLTTIILFSIALLVATDAAAQTTATPKQAYEILKYQTAHPTEHYPYFQLGNVYTEIFPMEHPIRDYNELMTDLYNIRLFYGNCLHYSIDQTLKQDDYLLVPHSGKRPTYEELARYLSERINNAQERRERVAQLYQTYYRLYDHYEQCRALYTAFAQTYTREKMAHLSIDSLHYSMLDDLNRLSDSVEVDIADYQQALKQCPIVGYEPVFRQRTIGLYRIDGLTKANLLVNDIPLWDYKGWVRNFLREQQTTYTDYYSMLEEEFLKADRENQRLLNTITRLDYESFMYSWVLIRQNNRRLHAALHDAALTNGSVDYLETIIPAVYEYYTFRAEIYNHEELLRKRLSDSELLKYAALLDTLSLTTCAEVQRNVHNVVIASDTTYRAICRQVVETAGVHETPFAPYENEFTGEKVDMDMLTALSISEIGQPVSVIPVGYRYLAILANHKVVLFDRDTMYGSPQTFGGTSTVLAAYKMTSNAIAIIMEDEIVFVDNTGKRK